MKQTALIDHFLLRHARTHVRDKMTLGLPEHLQFSTLFLCMTCRLLDYGIYFSALSTHDLDLTIDMPCLGFV